MGCAWSGTCSWPPRATWRRPSAATGGKCSPGARGEDDRPVETDEEDAKSYSQQETFARNVGDFGEIERVAKRMAR